MVRILLEKSDFEEEVEMLAQNKKACWHFFLGGPPSRVHRMASASSPLLRQLCVEKEIVGSLKQQQVFLMTFLLPHHAIMGCPTQRDSHFEGG